MKKISTTLRKAAELIEAHGLAKFTRQDADGAYCAHGAIAAASTGNAFSTDKRAEAFMTWLINENESKPEFNPKATSFDYGVGFAPWNNKPERTWEEVAYALRAGAHVAKEMGY